MTTMSVKYLGDLEVSCTHDDSGASFVTTAPKDNGGTGEAFSPSDLAATAVAACALTIMGLYAKNHDVDIVGTTAKVTKTMSASPRRLGCVEIVFTFPAKGYSDKEKTSLERAAHTCPVHLSLHPDVEQKMSFVWS